MLLRYINIGKYKDRDTYLKKSYESTQELRDLVNEMIEVSKNEILMRVGNFALKICKDGIYKTSDYESCYNDYPTDNEAWENL